MSKKIILRCSDGEEFVVDELAAKESQTIRHMIEDECTENGIPLPNVASKTLSKVIEYCNTHADASAAAAAAERPTAAGASSKKAAGKRLKEWDTDFVKVDLPILVDLAKAAHYLNIQGLLDLTCQTMANMIKGKSTEEIRKTFNLKNDFTPEEEEEMRRENQWALG